MLNNQPMGFYSAAVLVKDAQRHRLRIKPIDVQVSQHVCTVEHEADGSLSLRLGLNYVQQLRAAISSLVVAARHAEGPFQDVEDLARRVPALSRGDLAQLARIGALNSLKDINHRRDAIWQIEQVCRPVGPLLRHIETSPEALKSPLSKMETETTPGRRLRWHGTDHRLSPYGPTNENDYESRVSYPLKSCSNKGMVAVCLPLERSLLVNALEQRWVLSSISIEDETGIANVIIHPQLYERERVLVTRGKFLKIHGKLQNQDGVVHVKAESIELLNISSVEMHSHDFH